MRNHSQISRGAGLIEYVLIIAIISLSVMIFLSYLAANTQSMYNNSTNQLNSLHH